MAEKLTLADIIEQVELNIGEDKKDKELNEQHQNILDMATAGESDSKTYTLQKIHSYIQSHFPQVITKNAIDNYIKQYHINYYENFMGEKKKKYNENDTEDNSASQNSKEEDTFFYDCFEKYKLTNYSTLDQRVDKLVQIIYQQLFGFGVIDELVYDSEIFNEVSINGSNEVYVQISGRKTKVPALYYADRDSLIRAIDKFTSFDGKYDLNPDKPFIYSQTAEGNRVTAVIERLSDMPYLFHRNFDLQHLDHEKLIASKTLNAKIITLNDKVVKARTNISVIGEQGVGKSTALAHLAGLIPSDRWIGVLETSRELNLKKRFPDKNIVSLLYSNEGEGVNCQKAFSILLRANRDIIILGETREPEEAVVSIDAQLRQARGSLESFHSSSAERYIYDKRNLLIRSGKYDNAQVALFDVADATDLVYHYKFDNMTKQRYLNEITEIIANYKTQSYELVTIVKYNKQTNDWEFLNKLSDQLKERMMDMGAKPEDIATLDALFE